MSVTLELESKWLHCAGFESLTNWLSTGFTSALIQQDPLHPAACEELKVQISQSRQLQQILPNSFNPKQTRVRKITDSSGRVAYSFQAKGIKAETSGRSYGGSSGKDSGPADYGQWEVSTPIDQAEYDRIRQRYSLGSIYKFRHSKDILVADPEAESALHLDIDIILRGGIKTRFLGYITADVEYSHGQEAILFDQEKMVEILPGFIPLIPKSRIRTYLKNRKIAERGISGTIDAALMKAGATRVPLEYYNRVMKISECGGR